MREQLRYAEVRSNLDAVAKRSRAKLVAFLAARSRDLAAAEDALSEAFASALANWGESGCPANPEAWLLTVARRKLIDQMRRQRETADSEELEQLVDKVDLWAKDEVPDRRLALLFACAHPAIDPAVRAPLMLQTVLGLEAAQIASAFLVSPSAMAQRLVRAKTKIRDAGIPFSVPGREEMPERLEAVLDAIYAGFSEGWMDPIGADPSRRELAQEAMFLGRLITELLPDEPEAWGLLALMLYTEARRAARRSAEGEFVPLSEQDTTLWDAGLICEAEAALHKAAVVGRLGRYQLEAAIQSAHVERARSGAVSWTAVVSLYDALVQLTGSPVASINRALAVAEIQGPAAGLRELAAVDGDSRILAYQPYWAARAHLLSRVGEIAEAKHAFEVAMGMERDPAVRRHLERLCEEAQRAAVCGSTD